MPSQTLLATDVRARGVTAMAVLVMARDDATRGIAEAIDVPAAGGSVVRGTVAAREVLIEALTTDSIAWAQWLSRDEHANAATSMSVAVDDTILDHLRQQHPALASVIEDIRMRRAHIRSVAAELASSNTEHEIIDLTDTPSRTNA